MLANYLYWSSTLLLSLLYLASATMYVVRPSKTRQALHRLGYDAPLLVPLMVVIKILAPLVILSRISVPLSDLAYAGVLFHLGLAALAHIGVHRLFDAIPAVVGLLLLVISFATQNDVRAEPSLFVSAVTAAEPT